MVFGDVFGSILGPVSDAFNIGYRIGDALFGNDAGGAAPGGAARAVVPYQLEQVKLLGQIRDQLAGKRSGPPAAVPTPRFPPGTRLVQQPEREPGPVTLDYGAGLRAAASGGDLVQLLRGGGRQFPDSVPFDPARPVPPGVPAADRVGWVICSQMPWLPGCDRVLRGPDVVAPPVPARPDTGSIPGPSDGDFSTGGTLDTDLPVPAPRPGDAAAGDPQCGGGANSAAGSSSSSSSTAKPSQSVTVIIEGDRRVSMIGNRKMKPGRSRARGRPRRAPIRPEWAPEEADRKPPARSGRKRRRVSNRQPSEAQLRARERFAERARSGEFRRGRSKN